MFVVTGWLKEALSFWRSAAPDAEPQMVVNRFIAGFLAISFNIWALSNGWLTGWPAVVTVVYLVLGGVIAAHMLLRPYATSLRRIVAIIVDFAAVSYETHAGGAFTVWLLAGYVWVIFGNGFRFGPRYHLYAMVAATISFCGMVAVTPYWRNNPGLFVCGMLMVSGIPLYALALINRLSRARKQAEEANQTKSLFLTSVSHELRTPLNAVIGMGALLETSDLNPEQLQMTQTIATAARSLLSLINGILDMSRIEVGHIAVAHCDFDLVPLLDEIKTIFVAQASLKGVQLGTHVTARTPLLLHGDARKLHEILLNLVGNAIKFTESGSITVSVDMVACQDDQARLRFEVVDTGIGIAAEAHERIFDIFTQADETVVNRFGGTGLGLALVRKTVQLLGGEIGVVSAPGAGSQFWFELPMLARPGLAEQEAPFPHLCAYVVTEQAAIVAPLLGRLSERGVRIEHIAKPLPDWPVSPGAVCLWAFGHAENRRALSFVEIRREKQVGLPDADARLRYATLLHMPVEDAELTTMLRLVSAASGQERPVVEAARVLAPREKFHLLVADDNATNRYVIDKILRSAGHAVTLVNNGEEALTLLTERHFDIAVLDVNMPVMDGIEVAKIYRMAALGTALIPVVALTADATTATRQRCLEAGMVACLVKPVEPVRLLTAIDDVIQSARIAMAPQEKKLLRPGVADITAHPRFRTNQTPPVDFEVLDRLRSLGGDVFLEEVCDLFRGEARAALGELRSAGAEGNVLAFRAHAHALRSVSANVGARHIYDICQPAQSVSAIELRLNSRTWVEQIEAELRRVEAALNDYRSGLSAQPHR